MKTIPITIDFTEAEAESFFRAHKVRVFDKPVPALFENGKTVKMIENPTNNFTHTLEKAFTAVMGARTRQLLLQETDNLTIFNTLNKLK